MPMAKPPPRPPFLVLLVLAVAGLVLLNESSMLPRGAEEMAAVNEAVCQLDPPTDSAGVAFPEPDSGSKTNFGSAGRCFGPDRFGTSQNLAVETDSLEPEMQT